ncbi:fatty acyl-CoA reductase 1-like [Sitophilus oryzae]|uniref:Fatty acyl-CoA reductase n=1 Tax=Sitophilus oryzae TaxID=7048 RepID=A0A6J2XHQ0_SITOR|nr:fatty acyl-CoA reductase 1-like [Sitophilus oryzae]
MSSQIKEFYNGQNILLTGGTGYFGKMIIAKLLKSTEVKNIYLIVRAKEEIGFDKRVVIMFQEEIFSNTNEQIFLSKLHPIEGDLRKEGLGISKEDALFLKENINVVFHCGASLNMDAKLADAVMTNVNGTAEILNLMKGSRTLRAFVLVSTAYSNCMNEIIEEKFYEPPIDPKLLIMMANNMKAELLNDISSSDIDGI